MASATVLVCVPSELSSSEFCPLGHSLTTQTIYVSDTDPSVPSLQDADVGAFAFAFVIVSYLFGLSFGLLFRLFRSD